MTDDLHRERYEFGELEREAARMAQFTVPGGFWYRLFKWFERSFERDRLDIEQEIKDSKP